MELSKEQLETLLKDKILDDGEVFIILGGINDARDIAMERIMGNIEELVYSYSGYIPYLTPLTKELVQELIVMDGLNILINQIEHLGMEDCGWFLDNHDELANFFGYNKADTYYLDEEIIITEFKNV